MHHTSRGTTRVENLTPALWVAVRCCAGFSTAVLHRRTPRVIVRLFEFSSIDPRMHVK